MPAGMKYETAPAVLREVCDETTIYRINDGGMDLDKSNLPAEGWLPELAPIYRDKAERKAHVCLRIKVLEQARSVEELYAIHSLHYEVLKGDKAGISSIRVNDQYRIEFTVEQVSSETVVTICNILELSNHYK